MTALEKLSRLRKEMTRQGADAVVVPTSDPHLSEYLPEHWRARAWLSGFTGSAGTLVVTKDKAGLWTDGRYFLQAERELAGSGISLYRMGVNGTPTTAEFLVSELPGGKVAVDGSVCPAKVARTMQTAFEKAGTELLDADLVSPIWEKRPSKPSSRVVCLPPAYAGKSCKEKLSEVREVLRKAGADAQLYSLLEDTAWCTNLRGEDILHTPFFLSYLLVTAEEAVLYVDEARLDAPAKKMLSESEVRLRPYEALEASLQENFGGKRFLVSRADICWSALRLLEENPSVTVLEGEDAVLHLKGVKNETELKNLREAHVWDGVALTRFAVWLFDRLRRNAETTEYDACLVLRELRAALPENRGESFATIAAWGPNAAMMHYEPTAEYHSRIRPKGFLLVDSGGQFLTGTTDVTRTFALGPLTPEEQECYTLVLKSHLDLAMTRFPEGTTGGALDAIARAPVWGAGLDYRCGTGHGVGYYAGVHEGPQNFRPGSPVALKPGMTITDEPGIYQDGKFGIRIENLLEIVPWKETEYGAYLAFRPLTLFPVDTAPVLPELLTKAERDYLDGYHKRVWKTLAPYLNETERAWLESACRPLSERLKEGLYEKLD